MKVAVTATGPGIHSDVDPRFGRAKYFVIFDTESDEVETIDNTVNLNAVQGAGIQSAKKIVDYSINGLVTGNIGPKAMTVLSAADVKVFAGVKGSVEDAILSWKSGELTKTATANVEGHWM